MLRYKAKLWPEQAFQMLTQAVSDRHYVVRESAIDELAERFNPHAQRLVEKLPRALPVKEVARNVA